MATRAKKPVAASGADLGPDCRVLVLAGKEAFLREAYVRDLRKAIEQAGVATDVIRFDGAAAAPADVFDECRSFGLLGQHKIVVVDNADQFVKEDNRPLVERYAQSPSDTATLVLRADIWRPGKLDKMIEKVGAIIACDELTPAKATKAAVKLAQDNHQRQIHPEAAELLVHRVGPELGRIETEIAKLAAATEPGEPITADLVRAMVAATRGEEKAWVIGDYLLNPDPQAALQKLRELVEVSRIDPVPIRWAYIDTARKLHTIAQEVARGVPLQATGRNLRMWGPAAAAIRSIAARTPPARLAALLEATVTADLRAKTGQGDPVRNLEILTLKFARVARR